MTVKYGKFEIPSKITFEKESANSVFGRFIAEAFERGFGHTIGNSLRRIMMTALEAPAVIAVRLEGVPHEFMAIDGVIEDMVNIVLNLKGALLRKLPTMEDSDSRESRIITAMIDIKQEDIKRNNGQVTVTLGDIMTDSYFEVMNPELPLFTVTKPFKRQIDLRVAFGRGYSPSERLVVPDKTADEILIDASFSPVRLANYVVENTRVGQQTDYDRLILEITTDGRVTPAEALAFASQIALKHFEVFKEVEAQMISFDEGTSEGPNDQDEMTEKLALRIDEIELSVRSTNCLHGANIETIAELVTIPERKMLEFRNFGKKSLNEIKAKLHEMSLYLGMDLSKYGITPDNVKEKMRRHHEERHKRAVNSEEKDTN